MSLASCKIQDIDNSKSFILGNAPQIENSDTSEYTPNFFYTAINFILWEDSIYFHSNYSRNENDLYLFDENRGLNVYPLYLDTSAINLIGRYNNFNLFIAQNRSLIEDLTIVITKDSINSKSFAEMLNTLGRNGANSVVVQGITEEQLWIMKAKVNNNVVQKDSIDWSKTVRTDILFDDDNDGEFEIQKSLH